MGNSEEPGFGLFCGVVRGSDQCWLFCRGIRGSDQCSIPNSQFSSEWREASLLPLGRLFCWSFRGSDQCSIPNSQFSSEWRETSLLPLGRLFCRSFRGSDRVELDSHPIQDEKMCPSIRMRIENWELNIDQIP